MIPIETTNDTWRNVAERLGWPTKDLNSLASVLAVSKTTDRVARVTGTWIEIESEFTYVFEGTGRDGAAHKSELHQTRTWRWNYYAPAEVRVEESRHDEKIWCPRHAYVCGPDEKGCGLRDLIRVETCGCGANHHPDCEVWKAVMLEPAAVIDALEDKPIGKWVPPEEHQEKPKRSNNWSLPGQMRLT